MQTSDMKTSVDPAIALAPLISILLDLECKPLIAAQGNPSLILSIKDPASGTCAKLPEIQVRHKRILKAAHDLAKLLGGPGFGIYKLINSRL
jgi:hypothetical protein